MKRRSNLLLRSMMFVPGHNERLIASARRSVADTLIFDIEDSVVPDANKAVARVQIAHEVEIGFERPVFVRVNDYQSGHLLADVTILAIEGVTGFVYPKVEGARDIHFFSRFLEMIEWQRGFEIGTFKIVPLIETASAVLNAQEICLASERVIAIAYGCEDFLADLEGTHGADHLTLFVPRAIIAMAARATGVIPIDTVHTDVHDLDDLEYNLQVARSLGFEGMLVLHPKELELVHACFTPSKHEVEQAHKILDLASQAEQMGKGVAVLDGVFIGPPMVRTARATLERTKRCPG